MNKHLKIINNVHLEYLYLKIISISFFFKCDVIKLILSLLLNESLNITLSEKSEKILPFLLVFAFFRRLHP